MKIEKVSNLIYSLGAAIVIFGAWAKIIHKPYADTMLTVGLITEAILFCYMGITDVLKKSEHINQPISMDKISGNGTMEMPDNKELTAAIKRNNDILSSIFKTA